MNPADARLLTLLQSREPVWMGILNLSPDSFSDGGLCLDPARFLERAEGLVRGGARILDVGGASTRPGSAAPASETEIERVLPALRALRARFGESVFLSLDSYRPEVLIAAAEAGVVDISNDILAGRSRTRTSQGQLETCISIAARHRLGIVLMHALAMPAQMQVRPGYDGCAIDEVTRFLRQRAGVARAAGVRAIFLDPGIGFGKTRDHNVTLLSERAFQAYGRIGLPVLIGLSRKAFLASLPGAAPELASDPLVRDLASKEWEILAMRRGARVIRSHRMPSEVEVGDSGSLELSASAASERIQ